VFPPAAILVVDDTAAGVAAGRNAGMRTLGVTLTGNGLGLSAAEVAALDPADRARRGAAVARTLLDAGADDCVTGIGAVPEWLRRHGLLG
jgi:phosphonoacetaldehyde hydrolase